MSVIVQPKDSLIHEDVCIKINNLNPQNTFKVELRFHSSVGIYRSFGVFKSNNIGSIDLATDAPLRGTYEGVRKMGLFESVEPTDDVRFGAYCKCTPPNNYNYTIWVFDNKENIICTEKITKRLKHPDVERIEVEKRMPRSSVAICGTLFKPKGDGPFPTIMDISGTGGGINEQKGAALASRGFCAFSLAYFQFKHLPEIIEHVELDYFKEALEYLKSLPYTNGNFGLQGVSFGGTLAMFLSTRIPEFKAVVSINGNNAMDYSVHIKDDMEVVYQLNSSSGEFVYFINDTMCSDKLHGSIIIDENNRLQLEATNPNCAFRFVTSMDDKSTPAISSTNDLSKQLRDLERRVEVHILPGGHLMDPPCFPAHPICFSKMAGLVQAYGGDYALHGKSQFLAWEGTVQFFSKYLGSPQVLQNYSKL